MVRKPGNIQYASDLNFAAVAIRNQNALLRWFVNSVGRLGSMGFKHLGDPGPPVLFRIGQGGVSLLVGQIHIGMMVYQEFGDGLTPVIGGIQQG